jgi:hypothetical protein
MSVKGNTESATRAPSAPARKSPPWGERLARIEDSSRYYRPQKAQISKAVRKRLVWHWMIDTDLDLSSLDQFSLISSALLHRHWLVSWPAAHTRTLLFSGYGASGEQPSLFSQPESTTAIEHFTQALEAQPGDSSSVDRGEFSVNHAMWLALYETAKSVPDQDLTGWIVGGVICGIAWILGGVDFLIKSAILLTVTNSTVSIFADIKRGEFSANRFLSDLIQCPAFLGMIAIGRFADYGAHEPIVIFRSFMASIVVIICFWRSFRSLSFLAGLEGFDELLENLTDTFMNWLNQQRRH